MPGRVVIQISFQQHSKRLPGLSEGPLRGIPDVSGKKRAGVRVRKIDRLAVIIRRKRTDMNLGCLMRLGVGRSTLSLLIAVCCFSGGIRVSAEAPIPDRIQFNRDIRPIL